MWIEWMERNEETKKEIGDFIVDVQANSVTQRAQMCPTLSIEFHSDFLLQFFIHFSDGNRFSTGLVQYSKDLVYFPGYRCYQRFGI